MVDGPTGRPPVLGETDRALAPRDAGWTSSIQGKPCSLLDSVGEVRGVSGDLLLLSRGQVPGEDVGGGPGKAWGAVGMGDRQATWAGARPTRRARRERISSVMAPGRMQLSIVTKTAACFRLPMARARAWRRWARLVGAGRPDRAA